MFWYELHVNQTNLFKFVDFWVGHLYVWVEPQPTYLNPLTFESGNEF